MNTLIKAWNESGAFFCGFAFRMLIQSGILILILYALDRILRERVRASVRYCIWLLVLIKLVLPTTLSFPTGPGYWLHHPPVLPAQVSSSQELKLPVAAPAEAEPESASSPVVHKPSAPAGETKPVLAARETASVSSQLITAAVPVLSLSIQAVLLGLWLIGVVLLGSIFLIRLFMVRNLVYHSRAASDRCRKILQTCLSEFRGRTPRLKESEKIGSPAVCGLLRPTILMPAGLEEKLTDEQLHTILLHEMSHIRRGDLWVNLLQTILQIIYFYNPLVWLANHSIRKVREHANDEHVLMVLGRHECYSHTLIEVAEMVFRKPQPMLRLIGVMETQNRLNERITHMIRRPIPKSSKLGWTAGPALILLACILLPMAQGQSKPTAEPEVRVVAAAVRTPAESTSPPQPQPAPPVIVDGTRSFSSHPEYQNILDEIEIMDDTAIQSINDGNVNRIVSLFTEDGMRLPNQAEAAIGRQGLTQLYLETLRDNPGIQILNLQQSTRELWVAGDLIFKVDRYSLAFKIPSMRFVMTDYQKDLSVLQRQPDGSLKVVVGADSLDPIPREAYKDQSEGNRKKPPIVFHTVKTEKISADQMAQNIETVKNLDIEFHNCFIRHDADAALAYYANDALLLPLGKDIVRGKAALTPFIKEGMKEAELINNNQQIIDAGGTDQMIYIVNKFNWQFKNPANPQEIQSFPGKGIHVWQKQPDGSWKILLDIYNVSIPLPEA